MNKEAINEERSDGRYRRREQLLKSFLRLLPLLRPDEQIDPGEAGTAPEQLLQQHFAHESGAAGDEDRLARVKVRDGAAGGLLLLLLLRETGHGEIQADHLFRFRAIRSFVLRLLYAHFRLRVCHDHPVLSWSFLSPS